MAARDEARLQMASEPAGRARQQHPHQSAATLTLAGLGDGQTIAQRQAERLGLDLEHVALLRRDPVGERQRRGAEEMHMHVAGPAEQRRI